MKGDGPQEKEKSKHMHVCSSMAKYLGAFLAFSARFLRTPLHDISPFGCFFFWFGLVLACKKGMGYGQR